VLASLWARARVDDLMSQDMKGHASGIMRDDLKATITQLGIEYRLLTQFTSFVAVEEMVVTDGGQPRRIEVPVESPEGVPDLNGVPTALASPMPIGRLSGAGGGGVSGGILRRRASIPAATVNSAVVVNSVNASEPAPLTPEEAAKAAEANRHAEVNRKLHPSVRAVVERLRNKEALTSADQAGFIRDGKADVQVWLTEKSEANLAKLKELGFEIVLDAKNSRLIVGRVSIDKLDALAELTFVSYISPQVSK